MNLLRIILITIGIIGLSSALPISLPTESNTSKWIVGSIFLIGAALITVGGCLCCKRKKGFKEFNNEPGSATHVVNAESPFPIFRPLNQAQEIQNGIPENQSEITPLKHPDSPILSNDNVEPMNSGIISQISNEIHRAPIDELIISPEHSNNIETSRPTNNIASIRSNMQIISNAIINIVTNDDIEIDNNNGPISELDIQNIANNNAEGYIQNQNEIYQNQNLENVRLFSNENYQTSENAFINFNQDIDISNIPSTSGINIVSDLNPHERIGGGDISDVHNDVKSDIVKLKTHGDTFSDPSLRVFENVTSILASPKVEVKKTMNSGVEDVETGDDVNEALRCLESVLSGESDCDSGSCSSLAEVKLEFNNDHFEEKSPIAFETQSNTNDVEIDTCDRRNVLPETTITSPYFEADCDSQGSCKNDDKLKENESEDIQNCDKLQIVNSDIISNDVLSNSISQAFVNKVDEVNTAVDSVLEKIHQNDLNKVCDESDELKFSKICEDIPNKVDSKEEVNYNSEDKSIDSKEKLHVVLEQSYDIENQYINNKENCEVSNCMLNTTEVIHNMESGNCDNLSKDILGEGKNTGNEISMNVIGIDNCMENVENNVNISMINNVTYEINIPDRSEVEIKDTPELTTDKDQLNNVSLKSDSISKIEEDNLGFSKAQELTKEITKVPVVLPNRTFTLSPEEKTPSPEICEGEENDEFSIRTSTPSKGAVKRDPAAVLSETVKTSRNVIPILTSPRKPNYDFLKSGQINLESWDKFLGDSFERSNEDDESVFDDCVNDMKKSCSKDDIKIQDLENLTGDEFFLVPHDNSANEISSKDTSMTDDNKENIGYQDSSSCSTDSDARFPSSNSDEEQDSAKIAEIRRALIMSLPDAQGPKTKENTSDYENGTKSAQNTPDNVQNQKRNILGVLESGFGDPSTSFHFPEYFSLECYMDNGGTSEERNEVHIRYNAAGRLSPIMEEDVENEDEKSNMNEVENMNEAKVSSSDSICQTFIVNETQGDSTSYSDKSAALTSDKPRQVLGSWCSNDTLFNVEDALDIEKITSPAEEIIESQCAEQKVENCEGSNWIVYDKSKEISDSENDIISKDLSTAQLDDNKLVGGCDKVKLDNNTLPDLDNNKMDKIGKDDEDCEKKLAVEEDLINSVSKPIDNEINDQNEKHGLITKNYSVHDEVKSLGKDGEMILDDQEDLTDNVSKPTDIKINYQDQKQGLMTETNLVYGEVKPFEDNSEIIKRAPIDDDKVDVLKSDVKLLETQSNFLSDLCLRDEKSISSIIDKQYNSKVINNACVENDLIYANNFKNLNEEISLHKPEITEEPNIDFRCFENNISDSGVQYDISNQDEEVEKLDKAIYQNEIHSKDTLNNILIICANMIDAERNQHASKVINNYTCDKLKSESSFLSSEQPCDKNEIQKVQTSIDKSVRFDEPLRKESINENKAVKDFLSTDNSTNNLIEDITNQIPKLMKDIDVFENTEDVNNTSDMFDKENVVVFKGMKEIDDYYVRDVDSDIVKNSENAGLTERTGKKYLIKKSDTKLNILAANGVEKVEKSDEISTKLLNGISNGAESMYNGADDDENSCSDQENEDTISSNSDDYDTLTSSSQSGQEYELQGDANEDKDKQSYEIDLEQIRDSQECSFKLDGENDPWLSSNIKFSESDIMTTSFSSESPMISPQTNQCVQSKFEQQIEMQNSSNENLDDDTGCESEDTSEEFEWKSGDHHDSTKIEEIEHAASLFRPDESDEANLDTTLTDETINESNENPENESENQEYENEDEDSSSDESEEIEFIPSIWNSSAVPSRSSLKSLENTTGNKEGKSVVFKKEKYLSVYEYPREQEHCSYIEPMYDQSLAYAPNGPVLCFDRFFVTSTTLPFNEYEFYPSGSSTTKDFDTNDQFNWLTEQTTSDNPFDSDDLLNSTPDFDLEGTLDTEYKADDDEQFSLDPMPGGEQLYEFTDQNLYEFGVDTEWSNGNEEITSFISPDTPDSNNSQINLKFNTDGPKLSRSDFATPDSGIEITPNPDNFNKSMKFSDIVSNGNSDDCSQTHVQNLGETNDKIKENKDFNNIDNLGTLCHTKSTLKLPLNIKEPTESVVNHNEAPLSTSDNDHIDQDSIKTDDELQIALNVLKQITSLDNLKANDKIQSDLLLSDVGSTNSGDEDSGIDSATTLIDINNKS